MCMIFKFISICTYLSDFTLCFVVMLTTLDPISLGTILYLNCFRYIWGALGAWLIHEGGGTMRKLEPSLNHYLLHHSNAISVTSIIIYYMHTLLHQSCVGCIMACYSFFLVILVSFLKASQQWSLVASCDVFDVRVVGIHLYTIRPYLAMCYALKQISYWYIYDFLVDILFFPFCNYFVCISFFVDWYHHDLHLPRILYTWEKLHL